MCIVYPSKDGKRKGKLPNDRYFVTDVDKNFPNTQKPFSEVFDPRHMKLWKATTDVLRDSEDEFSDDCMYDKDWVIDHNYKDDCIYDDDWILDPDNTN